jgi:hypothetical protein
MIEHGYASGHGDTVDDLLSELVAKLGLAWLPIKTAPRDGSYILVYTNIYEGITSYTAYWNDDRYAKNPKPYWRIVGASPINVMRNAQPTHWRPQLEPPK